ncbi:ferredoxin-thioredoxin reductase catalytic domain-containing protein [Methanohalophilus halophilus]|uniref:ferredoxin:thioredoxin reductase n=1 Tax=Methanohalophilus halophilus TaxID=2177 RepID=A0A1L3Q3X6_9EURY|nr:ferredoxin-thioredoxin reductase catalytic domain-containing protein [Methanohalophilus halophilus]APH39567.1 ferredoxin:thioredoxin reductase [Methanohalophilus halophilus]RNI09100.1 ferredoxin:thioredoxin reductase [Methanohalophilus halophilus]SDW31177.1 Ferredoxin-thioredoxin reductase, catalytic subunit [Methanohalophilus halophilus]
MVSQEDKAKTKNWVTKYAQKKGYKLNPDPEMLDLVIEGLANNKIKYGKGYCPCRIPSGDEKEDRKIICPCIYHGDEIAADGSCHCDLFFQNADNRKKDEQQNDSVE